MGLALQRGDAIGLSQGETPEPGPACERRFKYRLHTAWWGALIAGEGLTPSPASWFCHPPLCKLSRRASRSPSWASPWNPIEWEGVLAAWFRAPQEALAPTTPASFSTDYSPIPDPRASATMP